MYMCHRGKLHTSLSISPGTASESVMLVRMQMFENSSWKCSCRHRAADALCHQLHRHHREPAGTQHGYFGQSFQLLELNWTNCAKKG